MLRLVTEQCHLLRNSTTQKRGKKTCFVPCHGKRILFHPQSGKHCARDINAKVHLWFSATDLFSPQLVHFSFHPVHYAPVQTEREWNHHASPKHLQQRRQRESNAINTQNILQRQSATRWNFCLNNILTLFQRIGETHAVCLQNKNEARSSKNIWWSRHTKINQFLYAKTVRN